MSDIRPVSFGPSLYGLGEILSVQPKETAVDLVTFLRARLEDDEALARRATEDNGTGEWDEPFSGVLRLDGVEGIEGLHAFGDSRLSRHIANWSPARVLAEVEAKRQILDLHRPRSGEIGWRDYPDSDGYVPTTRQRVTMCAECGGWQGLPVITMPAADGSVTRNIDQWRFPCRTLRLLALPFASHPDYDETWRPA